MIENKALFNRMAAEWIKEFMYMQKEFETLDILKQMPLQHFGIDFNDLKVGDEQRDYLFSLVEELIPIYAKQYGYGQKENGKWAQSNAKPEPTFESQFNNRYIENIEYEQNTGIFPPIMAFTKKLQAFFGSDNSITAVCDYENHIINVAVGDNDKADAMRILLPASIQFGNQTTTILVNGKSISYKTKIDETIVGRVLVGNPLFKKIYVAHLPGSDVVDRIFIVLKNTTVQWYGDNWASLYCTITMTAEDLAREIFKYCGQAHFCFCTELAK